MATETLLPRPRRPQKRARRHCYSGDPPECRVRPPLRCLQQWEGDGRETAGPPRQPRSLGEADGATLEPRALFVHLACRFCYWVQRPARAEPSSPPLSRHPRSAVLRPLTALPLLRGGAGGRGAALGCLAEPRVAAPGSQAPWRTGGGPGIRPDPDPPNLPALNGPLRLWALHALPCSSAVSSLPAWQLPPPGG